MDQRKPRGELTITAVYTAHAWRWGRLDRAELFSGFATWLVFAITNVALFVAWLFRRDLPSLRHGLVQRHVMLDRLLAEARTPQVLELAAGLSRRGASVSADPAIRYVEVDLPPVVAVKQRLLGGTAAGRVVAARGNLVLRAGAIEDTDLAALVDERPLFVIAEGLLLYLDAEAQRSLFARVGALVAARPGSGFAFDLVPWDEQPRPGRVGRALERWFKRFTKGQGFAAEPRSREDVRRDLHAAGFGSIDVIEPATAPPAWRVPFLARRTQQVVFVARCDR